MDRNGLFDPYPGRVSIDLTGDDDELDYYNADWAVPPVAVNPPNLEPTLNGQDNLPANAVNGLPQFGPQFHQADFNHMQPWGLGAWNQPPLEHFADADDDANGYDEMDLPIDRSLLDLRPAGQMFDFDGEQVFVPNERAPPSPPHRRSASSTPGRSGISTVPRLEGEDQQSKSMLSMEQCLARIVTMFPDVEPEHVKNIWSELEGTSEDRVTESHTSSVDVQSRLTEMVERLVSDPHYPRKSRKRRREDENTPAVDTKKLKVSETVRAQETTSPSELVECQACFDEVPADRSLPCEGAASPHYTCHACMLTYIKSEVGQARCRILCTAGCGAGFAAAQLHLLPDKALLTQLEKFQQDADIREAGLEDLEECPFCDYKAIIVSSIDEDSEFRCQNPTCEIISCRRCRAASHVPQTCAEHAATHRSAARQRIEEAMSDALVRACNKCKRRFIKEAGCNKMTCPSCHNKQCYVCSENIRDYDHFDRHEPDDYRLPGRAEPADVWYGVHQAGRGPQVDDRRPNGRGKQRAKAKCPLHDNVEDRHARETREAEEAARSAVLAENPGLDAKDLKITVPPAARTRPTRPRALDDDRAVMAHMLADDHGFLAAAPDNRFVGDYGRVGDAAMYHFPRAGQPLYAPDFFAPPPLPHMPVNDHLPDHVWYNVPGMQPHIPDARRPGFEQTRELYHVPHIQADVDHYHAWPQPPQNMRPMGPVNGRLPALPEVQRQYQPYGPHPPQLQRWERVEELRHRHVQRLEELRHRRVQYETAEQVPFQAQLRHDRLQRHSLLNPEPRFMGERRVAQAHMPPGPHSGTPISEAARLRLLFSDQFGTPGPEQGPFHGNAGISQQHQMRRGPNQHFGHVAGNAASSARNDTVSYAGILTPDRHATASSQGWNPGWLHNTAVGQNAVQNADYLDRSLLQLGGNTRHIQTPPAQASPPIKVETSVELQSGVNVVPQHRSGAMTLLASDEEHADIKPYISPSSSNSTRPRFPGPSGN